MSRELFATVSSHPMSQFRRSRNREIGRRLGEAYRAVTIPVCDALDAVRLLLTPAQLKKVKQPLSFQLDAEYIKGSRKQATAPMIMIFSGM